MPEYNVIPSPNELTLPAGYEGDHPFEQHRGPGPGDEKLRVLFYNRPKQDMNKSAKEGRPVYKDVVYIMIEVPGDRTMQVDKPADDADKARFPKQWEAFLRKETAPLEGTPLEEWPALTQARRMELKGSNILTVEDVAGLPDNLLPRLGFDGHALRKQAQAWLDRAKEGAEAQMLATELASRDEKIAGLEQQIQEMLKNMVPRNASPAEDPPRRKAGRPRKDDA